MLRALGATSSPDRHGLTARVGLAALVTASAIGAGCTSTDSPPQLERIDGPAEVDEERLGSQPGAVNDAGQGG